MGKPNGMNDETEWQLVSRRGTRRVSGEEEQDKEDMGVERRSRRHAAHVRPGRDLTGWRSDRKVQFSSERRDHRARTVQKRVGASWRGWEVEIKAQGANLKLFDLAKLGSTVTPIARHRLPNHHGVLMEWTRCEGLRKLGMDLEQRRETETDGRKRSDRVRSVGAR